MSSGPTPAQEPSRNRRFRPSAWLRWPALVVLAGVFGILVGSHVQSKIERGEKLSRLETMISTVSKSRDNVRVIIEDPAILNDPATPQVPELDIPEGRIYFIGEESIPIDKDYLSGWFNPETENLELTLRNLRSNKIRQQWILPYATLDGHYTSWLQENQPDYSMYENLHDHLPLQPGHFLSTVLDEGRLILTPPVVCVDKQGEVLWHARVMFHHSAELDHENNLWICSLDRAEYEQDPYRHETIVKIDSRTGKVLYRKRVREIFLENSPFDLSHQNNNDVDPYHLNDIQPVLEDSLYWKRGDLFISLRNISTVFLYRPETGKILWSNSTAWANQHDVEIVNDHTISIFDNNVLRKLNDRMVFKLGKHNRCIMFDFESQSPSQRFADTFEVEGIATERQGRLKWFEREQLLYVEATEQDFFVIADLKENKTYKCALRGHRQGKVANLRWFRLLDPPADSGGS